MSGKNLEGVLALLAGSIVASCTGGLSSVPPGQGGGAGQAAPVVLLKLNRGLISATGALHDDTLTFTSTKSGAVHVVLGESCDAPDLFPSEDVSAGQAVTFTVSATGNLAAEGHYRLEACFTADDGQTGRSVVDLEVDNSPPTVLPSYAPGAYCNALLLNFYCTDCATVVYSTSGSVGFDASGNVTSGTIYQAGLPLQVTSDATVSYAGIDRAGNVSEVQEASYDLVGGATAPVPVVADDVISGDVSSTEQSTTVDFDAASGLGYSIRTSAGGCSLGTIITSGTTVGTTTTATVQASSLSVGLNALVLCVDILPGCATSSAFAITRKDSALGWPTVPSTPLAPTDMTLSFTPLDPSIDTSSATPAITFYVDSTYITDPLPGVAFGYAGTTISATPSMARWPENTSMIMVLDPSGITDDAGNPLSIVIRTFTTSNDPTFLPFGNKTYDTSDPDTVVDNATGLVWTRCAAGMDAGCTTAQFSFDWHQAIQQCADRSSYAVGGRDDWRLPDVKELMSLFDTTSGLPYLSSNFAVDTDVQFWTATMFDGSNAWLVDTSAGIATPASTGASFDVLCVAGDSGVRAARTLTRVTYSGSGTTFNTDPAGDVVFDPASGLYWEQAPAATTYTSTDVASTDPCSGTLHGLSGWQRPTAAHFATLDLLTNGVPRIDTSAFSVTTSDCFWLNDDTTTTCLVPDDLTQQDASGGAPVWCVLQLP